MPGTANTVTASLVDSLPGRLYLLACDPQRNRLRARPEFGVLLRGAVIAELNLRGLLAADETNGGRIRATGSQRTGDPVLDEVLRTIEESRPRGWQALIRRGHHGLVKAVGRQLESLGVIEISSSFLRRRVVLRDPAAAAALRDSIRTVALGDTPVQRVAVSDAALVTLLVVGQLVLARKEIRQHRARLAELSDRGGEVVPALRSAVKAARGARMAAYSGG